MASKRLLATAIASGLIHFTPAAYGDRTNPLVPGSMPPMDGLRNGAMPVPPPSDGLATSSPNISNIELIGLSDGGALLRFPRSPGATSTSPAYTPSGPQAAQARESVSTVKTVYVKFGSEVMVDGRTLKVQSHGEGSVRLVDGRGTAVAVITLESQPLMVIPPQATPKPLFPSTTTTGPSPSTILPR